MKKKYTFMLFFIIGLLTTVLGCKTDQNRVAENTEIKPVVQETEAEVYLLPGPVTVDYTIKYYDVIDDRIIEFSDSAYFEKSVEPGFFINKLSELMQMRIDINSVSVNEDTMTIDFSSSSAPLNGTGAYEESCILESISELMFSVYDSIDYIYYTEDGKEYESGHISLSKDTPYAQRRSENNR